MNNIKKNGIIVLNGDDHFFHYLKGLALKKKLKVISFAINNKSSEIKLLSVKKTKNKYELFLNINNNKFSFYTKNNNKNNLYNILAATACITSFVNIKKLKRHFSNHEFSYVKDLLNSNDLKKNLLVFELSSKKKIVLVSIKKNSKLSDIESLGAEFMDE